MLHASDIALQFIIYVYIHPYMGLPQKQSSCVALQSVLQRG